MKTSNPETDTMAIVNATREQKRPDAQASEPLSNYEATDGDNSSWFQRMRGKLGAVAGVAALGLGTAWVIDQNSGPEGQQSLMNQIEYSGEINSGIDIITIDDGAIVRTDSQKREGDMVNNQLIVLDLPDGESISVRTPEGAYVENSLNDANGNYLGIQVDDLLASPDIDEFTRTALESDEDGIVWINEQKAHVTAGHDTEAES